MKGNRQLPLERRLADATLDPETGAIIDLDDPDGTIRRLGRTEADDTTSSEAPGFASDPLEPEQFSRLRQSAKILPLTFDTTQPPVNSAAPRPKAILGNCSDPHVSGTEDLAEHIKGYLADIAQRFSSAK